MVTDEELMLNAKKGDMKCVSELFIRYQLQLYNFFFINCKEDALSKDLVQNVFERVIKYRMRYDSKFSFKPWLFKIAWNEQNDYFRKRKLSLPGDDEMSKMIPQMEIDNEDNQESKTRLRKAIKTLTSDQQNLLQMTHYQGLKYVEVANVMDCSLSAIKVRMHRMMKTLRNEYQNIH